MKAALRLARKGATLVSPNPLVGAVIVKGGAAVGTGYHRVFGGPHAEIMALQEAGEQARNADLYINLEPCCHYGKTPPCVDALIARGIRRAVIGMVDPNPRVRGRGIKKLVQAGIEVRVGVLEKHCRQLNEAFVKFITQGLPFVILKAALTLDGNIATYTGDSKWITSEKSRRRAHRVRSEVDAVMVGSGTVVADDPLLTVRLEPGAKKNPLRIIVDGSLRIPLTSNVLKPELAAQTLIAATSRKARSARAQTIRNRGAEVLGIPAHAGHIDLTRLLRLLAERGIARILIEGGSELNAAALKSGIVDKIMFFYAPKIIGGRDAIGVVGGDGHKKIAEALRIRDMTITAVGDDVLVEGYVSQGRGKD